MAHALERLCRKITSFLSKSTLFRNVVENARIQIHNSNNPDMKTNGEFFLSKKLLSIMDGDSIVLDIGTNEGDYIDLLLTNDFQFLGKIVAIDPLAENIRSARNRFSDHINQVIYVESAATDFDGEVDFYKHVDRRFSGGDSLKPMKEIGFENESNKVTVQASKLSTIVYKNFTDVELLKAKIFFCKIDVEGAELLVLKGATELLESEHGINVIQFEFGLSSRAFRTYFWDIYSFLKGFNFEIYILYPDHLKLIEEAVSIDLNYPYGNFVAIKKNLIPELKKSVLII